ncbi:hypothetical protein [Dysosmobacter sp.]
MTKAKHKQLFHWVAYISVLCIALFCRELNNNRTLLVTTLLGAVQTVIYTGLVAVWGVSVYQRIVQPQIRKMLEAISALLFLWFLSRGIKYYLLDILCLYFDVSTIKRYLWYSYYIPMLSLPVFTAMIAYSLRKPESYRLPKKVIVILVSISTIFFFTVLTNDLHQLVFMFPKDAIVFSDAEYGYGILYYPCLIWMVGCYIVALAVMIRKCRLPNSHKVLWLPLVPLMLCTCYVIAYITGNVKFFDDITIVDSFSLIAILETAIVVGLIPSNTHYAELLKASDLSAVITDPTLSLVFTSDTALIPDKDMMRQAVAQGAVMQNGMRVSAYSISGGHVFWQEDMTELLQVIIELEELNAELEDRRSVLQEAYHTQHKRQSLVEKNRLYNIMQTQTQGKVARLYVLAEKLKVEDDEREINRLIAEIAVIAAYLKRRNNLIFIAEENDTLSASELAYCLKESLSNLQLCGAESRIRFRLSGVLPFATVTEVYDAFEVAVESALTSLSELLVILTEEEGHIRLRLNIQSGADLSSLANRGFTVEQDDENEWTLEYTAPKGGESA